MSVACYSNIVEELLSLHRALWNLHIVPSSTISHSIKLGEV